MPYFSKRRFPSIKRALVFYAERLASISDNVQHDYAVEVSLLEEYVIVLEDHRFLHHRGVDWLSVIRVLTQQLAFRRVGGASTIEMQFVRTVTGDREKTVARKFRECTTAWFLNFHFDKIALLRSYLRLAFFGSGITGSENAANVIFGKSSAELNDEEASFLAAMLVYPAPLDRNSKWRSRVERRAAYGRKLVRSKAEKHSK